MDLFLEHITKAWDLFNHLLFSSFIIFPNTFLFLSSAKLIPKIFILADSEIKQCCWHLSHISDLKSYKKQIWLFVTGTIWNVFSLFCDNRWLVSLAFQVCSYYQSLHMSDVFQMITTTRQICKSNLGTSYCGVKFLSPLTKKYLWMMHLLSHHMAILEETKAACAGYYWSTEQNHPLHSIYLNAGTWVLLLTSKRLCRFLKTCTEVQIWQIVWKLLKNICLLFFLCCSCEKNAFQIATLELFIPLWLLFISVS